MATTDYQNYWSQYSPWGQAGSANGLPPTSYEPAYGGVPTIPNPVASAGQAVAGNLANMPGIMEINKSINPNYDQQQSVIGDELKGVVPSDVTGQLQTQAAERGINMGSMGSPNTLSSYLARFLGTSYGIQRQGMTESNQLSSLTNQITQPYMVTPDQQQAASSWQSVLNAAPQPGAAVRAQEDAMQRAFNQYKAAMTAGGKGGGGQTVVGSSGYAAPRSSSGGVQYPQMSALGATGPFSDNISNGGTKMWNAVTGTWESPTVYGPSMGSQSGSSGGGGAGYGSFIGTPGGTNMFNPGAGQTYDDQMWSDMMGEYGQPATGSSGTGSFLDQMMSDLELANTE